MPALDRTRRPDPDVAAFEEPIVPDPRVSAVRSLGYDLASRHSLEYAIEETGERCTITVNATEDDLATRCIRVYADARADDGGRLWFFRELAAPPDQPIGEVGTPDALALVMRARRLSM